MVSCGRIIHGVEALRRLDMVVADRGFVLVDSCSHLVLVPRQGCGKEGSCLGMQEKVQSNMLKKRQEG